MTLRIRLIRKEQIWILWMQFFLMVAAAVIQLFNFISFFTSLPLKRSVLTENTMFDVHINACLTSIEIKLVKKYTVGNGKKKWCDV